MIILKKPCPKNIKDIEKIKSFKLIGQRAIELGATIDEIKELYNINSGKGSNKPVKPASHVKPKPVTPVAPVKKPRSPRSPINKKYITKLDNIT